MYIHPAHTVPYDELVTKLDAEIEAGNVSTTQDGPLVMYRYTQQCVFEKRWTRWSRIARGLILDTTESKRIVCTPFEKFFNYSEHDQVLPDEPFEVTSKVDGSLGLIFHYAGRWRVATRGSFKSEQAIWAETWLHRHVDLNLLTKGTTYLVEIIYNANKIVVTYNFEGLVLLAAYSNKGVEYGPDDLWEVVNHSAMLMVDSSDYDSLNDLLEVAKTLSSNEEGFVVRFESGLRIKIKGDEYCRVHRLISHVTPLAVWDMMAAGDDLTLVAKELPEEFRRDFETIAGLLEQSFVALLKRITLATEYVQSKNDKELGLWLSTQHMFDEKISSFIFSARKKGLFIECMKPVKMRRRLFETFRPTGNVLPGYTPSSLLNRFSEEASA